MTRIEPWHSPRQGIHHDDAECADGAAVALEDRRAGTAGKPLCERCGQLRGSSPQGTPARALAGVRVLLVEDDRDSREATETLLRMEGAAVFGARSAQEGSRLLELQDFDVALLDIVLPDARGDELLARIRSSERPQRRLPVICVTAYASRENRARVQQAGFDDFLLKPLDRDGLVRAIARLVRPQR